MSFDESLELLLKHEGGYVKHPRDPGGTTNLGVTKATWESFIGHPVTDDDMKNLTKEDVAPLYRERYWNVVHADDLPIGVGYAVFDTAVNSGPSRAVRFQQTVVGTAEDGKIGAKTIQAAKAYVDKEGLVKKYSEKRLEFLRGLDTWDTFGKGWTRRVTEVEAQALSMMTSHGT